MKPNLSIGRLTAVVVVLGLLWRTVRYALGFPIWGDEAFVAVNFITRDYAGLIQPLEYGQIVPLVFMWAELAISRALGFSEWALRLLPSAAGIAAVLLFWCFAQRVLPRRAALLAIGIFASSYYLVRHGAEVKPYTTDLLVALALNMLAWRLWERPRAAARWVALIALAGVAVWCSYPAAFIGIAIGCLLTWLLVRERFPRGILVGWLLYALVLAGSFLAMYLAYAQPHAAAAARLMEIEMWSKTFPPLAHPLQMLYWLYAMHTGLMFAFPHGGTAPGSIGTLVLVIAGAVWLARGRGPLLLLLLGPLVPAFVAAALKRYPYGGSARTMLYMAPAICLLAGLGAGLALQWLRWGLFKVRRWDEARRGARGKAPGRPARWIWVPRMATALAIASAALAILPVGGMIGDTRQPYQSPGSRNSRAAVLDLSQQTVPGDRWITFNAVEPVDYAPYLGDWRGVGGQFVFDLLRFHPVPLTWAPRPQDVESPPGGRLWLLCYRGPKVAFPEDRWTAYLDAVTRRLGPPQHQRYEIKVKKAGVEALDVYRFE